MNFLAQIYPISIDVAFVHFFRYSIVQTFRISIAWICPFIGFTKLGSSEIILDKTLIVNYIQSYPALWRIFSILVPKLKHQHNVAISRHSALMLSSYFNRIKYLQFSWNYCFCLTIPSLHERPHVWPNRMLVQSCPALFKLVQIGSNCLNYIGQTCLNPLQHDREAVD